MSELTSNLGIGDSGYRFMGLKYSLGNRLKSEKLVSAGKQKWR